MAKKKRRRLKKKVRLILILIPAVILAGILFFSVFRKPKPKYSNTAREAGEIMKEYGYTKRIVTSYTPSDATKEASEGYVTEDELKQASTARKTVYEYDADGSLVKESYYLDDVLIRELRYQFENGEAVRAELKDKDGQLINYRVRKEDSINHELVWYLYDESDHLIGITEVYDEKGNLSESFAFSNDDVKLYENLYAYNEKNQLVSLTTVIDGKEVGKQTFTYTDGKQTESIYEGSDGTWYRHVFEYDETGLLNYSRQYGRDNRELSNDRYTYAKNGLLIKDVTYKDNKFIQVIVYEYTK